MADTLARLTAAKEQGQVAPDFDLDLAFEILSGPLYFRLLITHQPTRAPGGLRRRGPSITILRDERLAPCRGGAPAGACGRR
ncbi:TetR/AcrR family transcriptional regulator C-terminal ligand-binding domain-containing protein [Nonomuraea sp. LP-02]|uniref:TetR/AcrR family transcriptional regulator C-terminal ligand-binding domain-containing protein n=1 Tax=Nonomuraea sp. LP-02 TaxID=3097960 RepID=UPI002E31A25A|nr:TetR/AcrR family transcriptional regulator C-terminal ligand-binding domain-containing protein [Nonomuraea sp. LP-02]MED7931353.1 TetR/AcrR family transcriptional regulator C-terminal ligand-binding domain-containing protein [Nonomuraea sp. LP-02]